MNAATNNNTDFTPAPANAKIDDKVVKKLVGEATLGVHGVLGVKGGLTDMFKENDNPTKGINITINHDSQTVDVNLKLVTETGKNIPGIVNKVTENITKAIQNTVGFAAKDICVEVSDTMTREEYEKENTVDSINTSGFKGMGVV